MQTRIGVVAILLDDNKFAAAVNEILHEFADIIVGRMGMPYKERNISVISLVVDGKLESINAMTGKLGQLKGINVKSAISKV